jgi:hypothetical protein
VKWTFIHFDDFKRSASESPMIRQSSAPALMTSGAFNLIYPAMQDAHSRGECRPCAYFLHKADGCRHGERCSFCHLCVKGDLKKVRKERIRPTPTAQPRAPPEAA